MSTEFEPLSTALLIVDVQVGFINEATKHVVAAVEALQPRYEHIFATRFINAPDSPHRKWIHWNKFCEGSKNVPIAFCPSPKVVVIDKTTYTCVTPVFLKELGELQITEMHVCGIDTDVCVFSCATDLFQNHIRSVVLKAACGSSAGKEQHEYALRTLEHLVGDEQIE